MHIIVDCPECQSRFQLHADLRGRRIRCPNSGCRAPFIVQESGVAQSDAANGPKPTRIASPGEPDAEPPPPEPRKPPTQPTTRPPTKSTNKPTARSATRAIDPLPADTEGDVYDWRSAPPPVRTE